MNRFLLCLTFLISACTAQYGPERPARAVLQEANFPAMRTFNGQGTAYPSRSNRSLARDFLDLTFRMESGREIPFMTRFEGPITLRVTGAAIPPTLQPDLTALLARLRREAGISITRVAATEPAAITVEVLPRRQMQRLVPQAACFVVPRVTGWQEFRQLRRSSATDWTTLTRRDQVTVFIPDDVAPQEVRDCLHEEIAQALGPLNDLYRLPDSVFNDDNFHTVLTGFDMLMLRLTYAPELRSGLSRNQVADRLPRLLERLNPEGSFATGAPLPAPTPRAWINAIETTLGPGVAPARRRQAAQYATEFARMAGWQDNRLAFSLFAAGRVLAAEYPERAIEAFLEAGAIYRSRRETTLHAAHVATHLAVYSLSAGHSQDAIQLIDSAIPVARASQNAALLATLLMLKAEALKLAGHPADAVSVRREGLGWALYGYGDVRIVNKRLAEIATLAPARLENGEI